MALAEVTIIPLGTGSTSVSEYVANIQKTLEQERSSGKILFQMTPMSTIIEGELDELFRVIRLIHELPFMQGAKRVSTSVKIDDRRDKKGSMEQKMRSVADKL
jgi:uncharacterized protein (TIGR00106 family)